MENTWGKSVLQYIEEKGTSNVCRLIFCARIADCKNIAETFERRTKNCTQLITGLLFIYSDFIIHLIEGLEDDVFQLCREVFTINPETITNIKCLYMQSDAKKRFFDEWYYRRMNDNALNLNTSKNVTDNFENASNTYRRIVLNLCDLYTELWNISKLKNYVSTDKLYQFITHSKEKANILKLLYK